MNIVICCKKRWNSFRNAFFSGKFAVFVIKKALLKKCLIILMEVRGVSILNTYSVDFVAVTLLMQPNTNQKVFLIAVCPLKNKQHKQYPAPFWSTPYRIGPNS